MIAFFLLLILLSIAFVRLELSIRHFLLTGALIFIVGALTGLTNLPLSVLSGSVMGLTAMLLYFTPNLRQRFLSGPLLRWFRKSLDSNTCNLLTALEEDSRGWEMGLFNGCPDWQKLMIIQTMKLNQAEREFMEGQVEELCSLSSPSKGPGPGKVLSPDERQFMQEIEMSGMNIPVQFGGMEFSDFARSCITQKLSSCNGDLAFSSMAPDSRMLSEIVNRFGTSQQREHRLPGIASGQEIPWIVIVDRVNEVTGHPQVGRASDGWFRGEEMIGFQIDWETRFHTTGNDLNLLGLVFHAHDPDGLLGQKRDLGMICALVPIKTDGVTVSCREEEDVGIYHSAVVRGRNVFVPVEQVVGGLERIQKGCDPTVDLLAIGVDRYQIAVESGFAKSAARVVGAYANVSDEFPAESGYRRTDPTILAEVAGLTYLLDSARILLESIAAEEGKSALMYALVRQQCMGLSRKVKHLYNNSVPGNEALSEHHKPPVGTIPRKLMDGSSLHPDVDLRALKLFGKMVMSWHPSLSEGVRASIDEDPNSCLLDFDRALCSHLPHALTSKIRTFVYGLSRGLLAPGTGEGQVRRFCRQVDCLSAALAWITDVALVHLLGNHEQHEHLMTRFTDAYAKLFLAVAVVKRFSDHGEDEREAPLMVWACQYSLHGVQQELDEILDNFPVRYMGPLLRIAVFPTGRYHRLPDDLLDRRTASILRTPGPVRDRLTEDVHLSEDPGELTVRIQMAADLSDQIKGPRRRLQEAGKEWRLDRPWHLWLEERVSSGDVSPSEAELLTRSRNAVLSISAAGRGLGESEIGTEDDSLVD